MQSWLHLDSLVEGGALQAAAQKMCPHGDQGEQQSETGSDLACAHDFAKWGGLSMKRQVRDVAHRFKLALQMARYKTTGDWHCWSRYPGVLKGIHISLSCVEVCKRAQLVLDKS